MSSRRSVFDEVFDVVVFGAGFAGYAAGLTLQARGRRVLLVGSRGDLLWEAGRAFCPTAGEVDDRHWRELVGRVGDRGGRAEDWIDGAITEVVGTDLILGRGVSVLYYVRPVAVELAGGADSPVSGVVVATKTGLRRLRARQWIDSSETGELLKFVRPKLRPRTPVGAHAHLLLQHRDWTRVDTGDLGLLPTSWPTERVLTVETVPGGSAWRGSVLEALDGLAHSLGANMAGVTLSHLSIEPIADFAPGRPGPATIANVASAVPGLARTAVRTLADRFELGLAAAAALEDAVSAELGADALDPLPPIQPVTSLTADVCVAGLGTGGSVAALTASEAGATVVAVEPLAFAGGIGTGGGIHCYCYGVAGGFQNEIDRRTRDVMGRYQRGPLSDGPFNPWAKMIALETMLRERGVAVISDAFVFDVEQSDGRVSAVLAASPDGVVRIEASSFVDGTGDGDICALAGAAFTSGRAYDGLLHAYSQSSGLIRPHRERLRMTLVNFDAGYCDPLDPEDVTRARLSGVRQYLLDSYENDTRPTYIAPALGIRQSRQVTTEYVLTLDDQIRGRTFEDPIGYTGSFFDHHGTDHEFDSDESLFWTWFTQQRKTILACELSYRMLIPRGTKNIWIASRCLGVTQDAHFVTRMQRDMQRVGEAAGFAAAEAAKRGETSLTLPYPVLRQWLDRTGALQKRPRRFDSEFGASGHLALNNDAQTSATAINALTALDEGKRSDALWWLYKNQARVQNAVLDRLDSSDPVVSWLAAGIAAMWGSPAAEPRLLRAIADLERGYNEGYDPTDADTSAGHRDLDPLEWSWVVPRWLCALALLRRCGTATSLFAIEKLAGHPRHGIDTLATIATTIEQLAIRGMLDAEERRAETILDRLHDIRMIGANDHAGRHVGWHSDFALSEASGEGNSSHLALLAPGMTVRQLLPNTYVDSTWQLHLADSRARMAIGRSPCREAFLLLEDNRAYVRQAARSVLGSST